MTQGITNQLIMPKIGAVMPRENAGPTTPTSENFTDLLSQGVKKVDLAVKDYEQLSTRFANGETVNVHELMVKSETADVSLRMMTAIRGKLIEAYHEIMRLQV